MFTLKGKRAIVTGASGGLGSHFARTLAGAGADVALAARRVQRMQALKREIEASGARACVVELDVTDAASVTAGTAAAAQALGGVDLLINNSGITVTKPALEQDEDDWRQVIDTNLSGAWHMAQACARQMVAQGSGGAVINIASIAGLRVAGQIPGYCASKAGLIQLTKALALEWARHGIRVNALAPGYIETDINREFFATAAGEALLKRVPQRRLGKPEDLDGALLLLASDAGRFMTGSVVTVDGGHMVNTL
ncbi:MAG: glucose 1-dehydrogenase [Betaproteobacteria bacterium]|nr:glucose 1-dehydrogenase [Betaproteobacteria bacterium]